MICLNKGIKKLPVYSKAPVLQNEKQCDIQQRVISPTYYDFENLTFLSVGFIFNLKIDLVSILQCVVATTGNTNGATVTITWK